MLDRPLALPTIVDSARPIVELGTTSGTTIASSANIAPTTANLRRARGLVALSASRAISPTANATTGPRDPAAIIVIATAGVISAIGTRSARRSPDSRK